MLKQHDLRFHKLGADGSGKCDAFLTGDRDDVIFGRLFEIDPSDKPLLDKAEGIGYGYNQKEVSVFRADGFSVDSVTYIAARIDRHIKPFSWYVNHVLVGAQETLIPEDYIHDKIVSIESKQDTDTERDTMECAIHR